MLQAQNLSDYTWENRLIVLVDTGLETSAMRSQLKILEAKTDELNERDLLLFQLTPKTLVSVSPNGKKIMLPTTETYRSLSIPIDFKGIILIGKDGGVKLKKSFEVPAADIFAVIDGMPMRKSEIRNKKKG